MENNIREAKQALRKQVSERLAGVGQGGRAAASVRACALLSEQSLWRAAPSVLFFAPLPGELDVWLLLEKALAAGKRVALPRFVARDGAYQAFQIESPESDLRLGHFGIREPAERCTPLHPGPLDLILVPGMAFDLQGHRLGRGKGFYDRLLRTLQGTTCGVAFDEQVVEDIPVEAHDVRLSFILTPTRWLQIQPQEPDGN